MKYFSIYAVFMYLYIKVRTSATKISNTCEWTGVLTYCIAEVNQKSELLRIHTRIETKQKSLLSWLIFKDTLMANPKIK